MSQIVLSDGRTISYEYDAEERITKVIESSGGTTEYTYDALGQLLTEIVNGEVLNSMEYDNYGNILSMNGVAYTYGVGAWKDLLTSYNGIPIVYDAQGNPTSYLGHTLTWEKGRQLKSFDSNTYTYNANGIRTSKTVKGVKHTYTLDGTKILRETWGNNTLIPIYDNEDSVCGIIYNDEPYYFQKNLQGDIIAITDKNAKVVTRYLYDAWGICAVVNDTSGINIAYINPFRYRGYYFDPEVGMYYLQSRYYNPSVGRFINADEPAMLGIDQGNLKQYDLFAYCENNPVMNFDLNGYDPWSLFGSSDAAALDFVKSYYPYTKRQSREYGAFIYKLTVQVSSWFRKTFYFYPYAFSGGHDNVVAGFIFGYLLLPTLRVNRWILGRYISAILTPIAFAHAHPSCRCHDGENFSNPDKLLTWLSGIQAVYVGTPSHKLKRIGKFGSGLTVVANF